MSNKHEDDIHTLKRLIAVRAQILKIADALLLSLTPFLFEEQSRVFPECIADIQKVYDACLVLKQKVIASLEEGVIKQNIQSFQLFHYLSKLRHDLRNSINVIHGYSEMILEEMQKKQKGSFDKQFEIMLAKVDQLLMLIDALKCSEAGSSLHHFKIMKTDESLEYISEEYRDFKEKISILIVDDDQESCEILQRYLGSIGYKNTKIANNGAQALALLEKNPVELVLLDINMPQMNGLEVLQRLKHDLAEQRLMVLMISAADTQENMITCIRLGAVDFLPKPFNAEFLRVRIGSCIEKKWFIEKERVYRERLELEQLRFEALLRSVFPSAIVEELTETGTVQPTNYKEVAIMFIDVVSFTEYCDTHEAKEVFENLQKFAEICESAAIKHHLQKIKTIGDSFLATGGLLVHHKNSVLDCIRCAKEILENTPTLVAKWQLHVGIHFGSVTGGIIGHRQYLFDIWGDVVNTAARIQTQSAPNRICMSKQAWENVKDLCQCRSLGVHPVRGKAPLELFEYVSGG